MSMQKKDDISGDLKRRAEDVISKAARKSSVTRSWSEYSYALGVFDRWLQARLITDEQKEEYRRRLRQAIKEYQDDDRSCDD